MIKKLTIPHSRKKENEKTALYEGCSKSIGPLVGKNTIIYLDV